MTIRYSKLLLVAAMAFYVSLVAFGNITDYGSNLAFVQHVLAMDTVFPESAITYRAIEAPAAQHAAYLLIIALETLTGTICWLGAWRMLQNIRAPADRFNRSKNTAVIGLTLGFLLWQAGFMAIGGEWFGMWMSTQWNGLESAFRFSTTLILVLIFLTRQDDELAEAASRKTNW